MLSYLDRPLVQIAFIVICGLIGGALIKRPTWLLVGKIVLMAAIFIVAGFVIFYFQLNDLSRVIQVMLLTPIRDEWWGIGRFITLGYALALAAFVVAIRLASTFRRRPGTDS